MAEYATICAWSKYYILQIFCRPPTPLHSTPLTGRAIKPQRQGHIGGPIAQPW